MASILKNVYQASEDKKSPGHNPFIFCHLLFLNPLHIFDTSQAPILILLWLHFVDR